MLARHAALAPGRPVQVTERCAFEGMQGVVAALCGDFLDVRFEWAAFPIPFHRDELSDLSHEEREGRDAERAMVFARGERKRWEMPQDHAAWCWAADRVLDRQYGEGA